MASPDGAIHSVVNGEFYGYHEIRDQLRVSGYQFATDSDSEIALHLYHQRGIHVAKELRGEFAVIIADEREQIMIAIRDRFGLKPLYYAKTNGNVYFASEIKALLALGVPEHINRPEMQAIQRRLGWAPASLNINMAMRNWLMPLWSDELKATFQ